MPKLFLGNREVTPAIYSDGANRYSPSKTVENGTLKISPDCEYVDLTGVDTIDSYALSYAYYNTQNNNHEVPDFSNIKKINSSGLYYAFYNNYNMTGTPNFSSLIDLSSGNQNLVAAFQYCKSLTGTVDISALKVVPSTHFQYIFQGCSLIEGINMSSLEYIYGGWGNFYYAFSGCTELTDADFRSLKTIRTTANSLYYLFNNCTNLENVNFNSLTSVFGSESMMSGMFYNCKKLASINFESLTDVSGKNICSNMCYNDILLSNINLNNLNTIRGESACSSMFKNCTSLTSLSFPKLINVGLNTNAFNNMLQGVTGCTVHFPSNLQTIMESWSDVIAGFGGTDTTILFDLPSYDVLDLTKITSIDYLYEHSSQYNNLDLTGISKIDISKLKTISGNYACQYMFQKCLNMPSEVDISDLETINDNYTFQYMFSGCTGSFYVDMSSLKTINGDYTFQYLLSGSTGSSTIDLSGLKIINGNYPFSYMFQNYNGLNTEVDISNLEAINGNYAFSNMFYGCKSSPEVDLSGLKEINGQYIFSNIFYNCTGSPTININGLEIINGNYALSNFYGSGSLYRNVTFPSLKRLNGYQCAYQMNNGTNSKDKLLLPNLTTIGGYRAAYEMCRNNTNLTEVDLGKLSVCGTDETGTSNHDIIFSSAFNGCTNLTSINLESLENATYWYFKRPSESSYISLFSYTFSNTGITNNPLINVSSGKSFSGCFSNCSSLTDGTFKKLAYIIESSSTGAMSSCFNGCTNMTKCDFPALMKTRYNQVFNDTFYNCKNANFTDVRFPMLINLGGYNPFYNTNAFRTSGTNRLTVHFRKDMQSTISALSGYSTLWGAGAIVFDQIGTITVDGNNYLRIGYCNKPGYIAWIKSNSNIVINGNTYTYYQNDVDFFKQRSELNPDVLHGVAFIWKDSINDVSLYSHKLDLTNNDSVYSSTNIGDPDLGITAADIEFVYTSDSAEPNVGDSVYSDLGTTVIGTISVVA